jgi:hypothetical protein
MLAHTSNQIAYLEPVLSHFFSFVDYVFFSSFSVFFIAYYCFRAAFNECILRFQASSTFWILGDAFIEAYMTNFDIEVLYQSTASVGFLCIY